MSLTRVLAENLIYGSRLDSSYLPVPSPEGSRFFEGTLAMTTTQKTIKRAVALVKKLAEHVKEAEDAFVRPIFYGDALYDTVGKNDIGWTLADEITEIAKLLQK
jgi:hypothetical protein